MRNLERQAAIRARRLALAGLVSAGMALAWMQRFVMDDAFIAYRYARHAARGLGFVWNAGEAPLEGFTSFAWTLLLALAARVGLDPEPASMVLGLLCFGGTLLATYALASATTRSAESAFVCAGLVALQPTSSAFATGGLETSAQTLLATATLAVVARAVRASEWRTSDAVLAGALGGLAVTVRMDAVVLLVVALAAIARHADRRRITFAVASASAFLAPWLAYRLVTFGRLLPNTYYVKVAGDSGLWLKGLDYLATFAVTSGVLVALAMAIASYVRRRDAVALPSFAFVLLWCAYVVLVGADFMEFRFMACAIPAAVVLFVWMLEREVRSKHARLGLTAALVLASLYGWRMTRGEDYFRPGVSIESVRALAQHIDHPEEDWRGIGGALHRAFPSDTKVVLALRPTGVIADVTDLPVVDVFGLNDRWVAENGSVDPEAAAGHRRVAPVSYLVSRGVNLSLGTPTVWRRGEPRKSYAAVDARRLFLSAHDVVPPDARVIEIPLDDKRAFRALYLTPHPSIDAKIASEGWRVFPINR